MGKPRNNAYYESLEHGCSKIYSAHCAVQWNHMTISINKHSKLAHLRCEHKYANVFVESSWMCALFEMW